MKDSTQRLRRQSIEFYKMSPDDLPIFSASDRIKQLNNIDKVKRWQELVLSNGH